MIYHNYFDLMRVPGIFSLKVRDVVLKVSSKLLVKIRDGSAKIRKSL